MPALAAPFQPVQAQRAFGLAAVHVVRAGHQTRLADLAQRGSARAMLPRCGLDRPEVVFLNTSGGLTSGDQIGYAVTLGPESRLQATTQTAERAYLAPTGPAALTVRAELAPGARLDWLPQETILYEGAHLQRVTEVALQPGATCLLVEMVVLGRRAMGEAPALARLSDRRMVTFRGRPLWAEAVALDAAALRLAAGPAVLAGDCAFATLALCGAGAEAAADGLRALPVAEGVTLGISGWNGRSLLRATAADPWALKRQLARCISHLTTRPVPRAWQLQGACL